MKSFFFWCAEQFPTDGVGEFKFLLISSDVSEIKAVII